MIRGAELDRSPEAIETQIAETRASLDRTLREIERRLSPSAHVQRLRERVGLDPYYALGALGAIAVGAWLALRGWRRVRTGSDALHCDGVGPIIDDMPVE